MSERDFFPDNTTSSSTRNDRTPDSSLLPQTVPRAGMGIADRIGFPAAPAASTVGDESFSEAPFNSGSTPAPLAEENHSVELSEAELSEAELSEAELSEADFQDTEPFDSEFHKRESQSVEFKPLGDSDDPALIPELAPLATTTPLLSSRSADDITLDEFDSETTKQSGSRIQEYSGGGGSGNNDGGLGSFDDNDGPGGMAQDLFSHLAELRARILYSVLAVALASAVTWHYGKWIQEFLARPIISTLKASGLSGAQLITIDPTEGFYLYFQITLSAAILLAAPFILFQIWRFIEPALTRTERRYTIFLVPFSVILFFSGVVLGYVLSPLFFSFFLQFQPSESVANFSYGKSVALLAKMLLVFGICFQVPVVTIFLNKVGILSRNFLIEYWRHAVVVIFTVVAIITPTWDPLTLCACAGPPCLLYGLSIWLVKWL